MKSPLRILLLEDVPTDAELIFRELRRARLDFEWRRVESAETFLQELDAFKPDIILSDFWLPQFDALAALRLRKERGGAIRDLPFILVTGSQSEEVAVQCIKEGADDYILKSSLKRLPSAVTSALKNKETERERERAEEALRRSEEHFRSLIENATDIITVLNRDGVIRYESPSVERVLGYPPEELVGRNVFELIDREDHSGVKEALARVVQEPGVTASMEYRFRHRDGSWRVLETIGRNLVPDRGQALVANSRDVTERKQAEEQIRAQAALLDKAKDAILVHDLQKRIHFWNKGAESIYGWTAAEALDQSADELLGKDHASLMEEARQRTLEKGEWHGELRQWTKKGEEILVESSWSLVSDSRGHPSSVLVINTDATEKKRLQNQFLRVQRMESIGTLAGGIAHDLNNVLTPVMVAIRMLREEMPTPIAQAILETLEASIHRGSAIVQQVLSFARGVEGERTLLDVRHPLSEVASIAKETFSRSIYISTKIEKDLWPVLGDATQLHQIFMNLCVNARDAMPHGGKIQIQATNVSVDENYAQMQSEARPGRYVLVTVCDTGMGIPPELLSKIFEPFFTTKEVGKGTGLGLSTVLGIVKSHGGFLNVYSEVGKGTRFNVYLPAADQRQPVAIESEARPVPRGAGECVLVVDDEFAVRDIIRLTLEQHGYKVLTASDGTEAVALCAQQTGAIHAAIVDVMMPFMDGPSTIRAMKRIDPEIRYIVVSGLMDNSKVSELAENQNVLFLTKPFTTEQMLEKLQELLPRPQGCL